MPISLSKFIQSSFRIFAVVTLLFLSFNSTAQIGIGVNPPDSSAILHLQDTARGLLIPRMTAAQRNAIQHPAVGLLVYQTDDFAGYWSFDGNTWGNISQGNKGAHLIVLTDDITDDEAVIKIQEESGPFTREIRIIGCTNLTTVDLSKITQLANIVIGDNPLLQSVNLNFLTSITGGEFGLHVYNSPALTTLSLPLLKKVITFSIGNVNSGGINIADTKIVNINLPRLEKVTSLTIQNNTLATTLSMPLLQTANSISISGNTVFINFNCPILNTVKSLSIINNNSLASIPLLLVTTMNYLYIKNNNSLLSVALPLMTAMYNLNIADNNSLLSVSLPSMTVMYNITITNNNSLASVSLPVLTTVGSPIVSNGGTFMIRFNPNLSSINIVTFTSPTVYAYDFSHNKLSSASVNDILHKFVSITPAIVSKILGVNGQTPPAPPTGQGIIDFNTLSIQNTLSAD